MSSKIHGRFTDGVLWLLHGDGVLPGVTVDCHRGLRPLTHEDIRARFGLFTYLVHWFTTARTHARTHTNAHTSTHARTHAFPRATAHDEHDDNYQREGSRKRGVP